MAGIDLATAQTHLDMWLAAEQKVASGQSYAIGNRQFRRADLAEIRDSITYWDGMVQSLTSNNGQRGIRVMGAVPLG
jgi:hypothetical protein